jgi:hypothetical protein
MNEQARTTIPFEEIEAELLADPQTRAAYDVLEPAYQIARLRIERGLTPKDVDVKGEVSVSARINITGIAAQRKVSRLLLDVVGTQLYGESPSLVAEERLVWRVPVWLGLSPVGAIGQVGTLDVDTQTGEVLYSQQLLDEIAECGDALARRTASS